MWTQPGFIVRIVGSRHFAQQKRVAYRHREIIGRGNPRIRRPERGAVRHDEAPVGVVFVQ